MSTASDNTAKWAVRKFGGAGLPVGFEYFTTNPNIPAGSLPLLGGVYSRTLYKDLWNWVQEQTGYLIEESEWQEKSAANEGNVPFYSTGDGITTFRVPSLKCWVKGANGIEEVGSYLSAGTVQPKSIVGMWLVKAYGTVTNVGSADVSNIAQGLTELENRVTPIANGGTGATTAKQARANLEVEPIGTIFAFAGSEIPNGYLPCNGSAISRTTYADLYSVIGTTYGAGDGSTTFNLPNLTDKFIQGSDTVGTVKSAGLPNISGNIGVPTMGATSGLFKGSVNNGGTSNYRLSVDTTSSYFIHGKLIFNASNSNPIYGNSTTVQPPALTMRYIIKY